MRCTVSKDDLRRAVLGQLPPGAADTIAAWDHEPWYNGSMRVEAAGDRLEITGPYASTSAPAEIEEPGVLFIRPWEFVECAEWASQPDPVQITAIPEYVQIGVMRMIYGGAQYEVFDQDEEAPEEWDFGLHPAFLDREDQPQDQQAAGAGAEQDRAD